MQNTQDAFVWPERGDIWVRDDSHAFGRFLYVIQVLSDGGNYLVYKGSTDGFPNVFEFINYIKKDPPTNGKVQSLAYMIDKGSMFRKKNEYM